MSSKKVVVNADAEQSLINARMCLIEKIDKRINVIQEQIASKEAHVEKLKEEKCFILRQMEG